MYSRASCVCRRDNIGGGGRGCSLLLYWREILKRNINARREEKYNDEAAAYPKL